MNFLALCIKDENPFASVINANLLFAILFEFEILLIKNRRNMTG